MPGTVCPADRWRPEPSQETRGVCLVSAARLVEFRNRNGICGTVLGSALWANPGERKAQFPTGPVALTITRSGRDRGR